MNTIVLLSIILFALMALIGKMKGVRSFLSLVLNFAIIFVAVIFMLDTATNPIYITIIACIIISAVNLFFINEVNKKTTTAFIATIVTIAILFLFIFFITKQAMIQGFGEEEIDEIITVYSLHLGIDFVKVTVAMIVMSTVGAIIDVAISITSPMQEIANQQPTIKRKDLFLSGMTIGKDILGSNANTLFFAFIGGYMALLIWVKDLSYTFGDIINSKIFSAEIITIFCAGIGIALIIPIAAFINAFVLTYKSNDESE
ncbi:MAG TPA: YibE/F family protein [Bacillota bacterium]|nr:YibE/F family protein [Bacillota bacterium]